MNFTDDEKNLTALRTFHANRVYRSGRKNGLHGHETKDDVENSKKILEELARRKK